ncbi:MAG: hypothetical protein IJ801_03555 [Lachnospiraceae bacterium]|nr:hypothetical protein [Lachnospiraceae bacterium]
MYNAKYDQERSNYFGTFTWAFDNMRREILKARSCEREAVENNKTVTTEPSCCITMQAVWRQSLVCRQKKKSN